MAQIYEFPKRYKAAAIRIARCSRGYTNGGSFAKMIGMSQSNFSKIEAGKLPITEKLIEKISEVTKYPKSLFEETIEETSPISWYSS